MSPSFQLKGPASCERAKGIRKSLDNAHQSGPLMFRDDFILHCLHAIECGIHVPLYVYTFTYIHI